MKKNKNLIILILILALAIIVGLYIFNSCEGNSHEGAAIKYVDANDNVTASLSGKVLSLLIADQKYKYSAYLDDLDMVIAESNDGKVTTLGDAIIVEACAYGKKLLQAEFLLDNVYGASLTEKETIALEKKMNEYIGAYDSESEFEDSLSAYGADIEAVERYIELYTKYEKLSLYLYSEGGPCEITDEVLCDYFAKSHIIADHIYFSFEGELKDDGTRAPLTESEIEEKKVLSQNVFLELQSGAIDFDAAIEKYSDDNYRVAYEHGYFIPYVGISGLDEQVQKALGSMTAEEIRMVETDRGVFILRRNEMVKELCLTNEAFAESLRNGMKQSHFEAELETAADGAVLDKGVIGELDVGAVKELDIYKTFIRNE